MYDQSVGAWNNILYINRLISTTEQFNDAIVSSLRKIQQQAGSLNMFVN